MAPKPMPTGSIDSTSVRMPGEASAPRRPPPGSRSRCAEACSRGSLALNSAVPSTTAAPESTRAAAGATSAIAAAVSSGPAMKIVSVSTESSA